MKKNIRIYSNSNFYKKIPIFTILLISGKFEGSGFSCFPSLITFYHWNCPRNFFRRKLALNLLWKKDTILRHNDHRDFEMRGKKGKEERENGGWRESPRFTLHARLINSAPFELYRVPRGFDFDLDSWISNYPFLFLRWPLAVVFVEIISDQSYRRWFPLHLSLSFSVLVSVCLFPVSFAISCRGNEARKRGGWREGAGIEDF